MLVLGARGMLGSDLCPVLEQDHAVFPYDIEDGDITDRSFLTGRFREVRPAWVVNCAAFTDVDGAETRQEEAYAVNRDAAAQVAVLAREVGARLIHISTDFVFDGKKGSPYREDDEPNPLAVYGRSKWEGERKVGAMAEDAIIVRTSWTFGKNGTNFVEKILARASQQNELRVVSDQRGSPTYTLDLSRKVAEILGADLPGGTYHVTNSGSCTRVEQASKILELTGVAGVRIVPVPSSEFPTPAARPENSVLENAALQAAGLPLLRPWEEALAKYLGTVTFL